MSEERLERFRLIELPWDQIKPGDEIQLDDAKNPKWVIVTSVEPDGRINYEGGYMKVISGLIDVRRYVV